MQGCFYAGLLWWQAGRRGAKGGGGDAGGGGGRGDPAVLERLMGGDPDALRAMLDLTRPPPPSPPPRGAPPPCSGGSTGLQGRGRMQGGVRVTELPNLSIGIFTGCTLFTSSLLPGQA